MAVTLAFGILFSVLITLVLVPVSCVVLREITERLKASIRAGKAY